MPGRRYHPGNSIPTMRDRCDIPSAHNSRLAGYSAGAVGDRPDCWGHCQVVPFVTPMGVATDSLPNWTASTYMPLKAVLEAVTVNSMVSPLLTPVALGLVTFFTAETVMSGALEHAQGCTPPGEPNEQPPLSTPLM